MSVAITSTKNNGRSLESEILCKNGCGYYGNSIQWNGYCSICYRKLIANKNESIDKKENSPINKNQTWNDAQNILKYKNKNKQTIQDKQTISNRFNLFRRSSSAAAIPSTSSSSHHTITTNGYNNSSPYHIQLDLKTIELQLKQKQIDIDSIKQNFQQLYQSLNKNICKFLDSFIEKQRLFDNTNQYEYVQDFYKRIYNFICNHASIKTYFDKLAVMNSSGSGSANISGSSLSVSPPPASDSISVNSLNSNSQQQLIMQNNDEYERLIENFMLYVESCVCYSLYDYVFPSIMSEFEDNDIKLQKRIRSFYWITNEMIGTCIDENSILYRDCFEEALSYIIQMDSKRTPFEKMLCITECSKNIYKSITISSTSLLSSTSTSQHTGGTKSASADDYLPAFIYIVLKANPTLLYSNMNYIARYAYEKRVLQGEHAYHFCSLNAVITHIENINASHLNISAEQFDKYCRGLANNNNGIKLLQTNLKLLNELRDKQEHIKRDAFKLQTDMNEFYLFMKSKVNNCIQKNDAKFTNQLSKYLNNETNDSPSPTPTPNDNVTDDGGDTVMNTIEPVESSDLPLQTPIEPTVLSDTTNSNGEI